MKVTENAVEQVKAIVTSISSKKLLNRESGLISTNEIVDYLDNLQPTCPHCKGTRFFMNKRYVRVTDGKTSTKYRCENCRRVFLSVSPFWRSYSRQHWYYRQVRRKTVLSILAYLKRNGFLVSTERDQWKPRAFKAEL